MQIVGAQGITQHLPLSYLIPRAEWPLRVAGDSQRSRSLISKDQRRVRQLIWGVGSSYCCEPKEEIPFGDGV
jgi:hypothetical protein